MYIMFCFSRASEILFSLAHMKMLDDAKKSSFSVEKLFLELVQARRNLGIFQHHDGITGTAKDHVVDDYGNK
jgi:alpha-mannosidase II